MYTMRGGAKRDAELSCRAGAYTIDGGCGPLPFDAPSYCARACRPVCDCELEWRDDCGDAYGFAAACGWE